MWAARRRASVCWALTWVTPAASNVLMSRSVKDCGPSKPRSTMSGRCLRPLFKIFILTPGRHTQRDVNTWASGAAAVSPTTPRAALHESLSSAARTLSIRATGSLSTSWTRRLQHGSQGNEPSSANQQKSLSHYRSLRQYQSHHQSRSHHPCLKLQQTTFPIVSPRRSPPRRSCSSLTKHIQRHHHHLLPR